MTRAEQIERSVMEHFLGTGKPATVDQIAGMCGVSVTTVRVVLRAGVVVGVCSPEPWGALRQPSARSYYPTREALRQAVIAARLESERAKATGQAEGGTK